MPRFLYLVTAHSNPAQTSRLLRAVLAASPGGRVLLHADPSGEPLPAQRFADEPRVLFYPHSMPVRWGDFSLVEAVLGVVSWAQSHAPFDWLIWISGQDYPLGPLHGFEARLAGGPADAWLRHFPGYTHPGWPAGEAFRRYDFAYRDIPSFTRAYWFPKSFQRALERGIRRFNRAQSLLQLRPRHRNNPTKLGLRRWHTPYSADFPCIGGWPWFNVNARAISRIFDFVATHPDYVAHYKQTYCPDESFFHTILVNDRELKIENDPLRHVSWDSRPSSSPRVITRGPLFDAALASGQPFARKFDVRIDAGCLDVLDAHILAAASPA